MQSKSGTCYFFIFLDKITIYKNEETIFFKKKLFNPFS